MAITSSNDSLLEPESGGNVQESDRMRRRNTGLTRRALLLGLALTALCDLWIHWAELVLGGRGHTALANTSIPVGAFNVLFLPVIINLSPYEVPSSHLLLPRQSCW